MNKIFLLLIAVFAFTSCMEDPEIWDSSVKDLAGDWFVRTYTEDGSLVEDYKKMYTYNTAADNGDMWMNMKGIVKFGSITKVSTEGMTFEGTDVYNVFDGEVLSGKAHSKTGNVTDSIYMHVVKDGTEFIVAGHRKTGFPEDNY